jgi:ABC-type glycerol-3-phosphate transport system substrate-binding protein
VYDQGPNSLYASKKLALDNVEKFLTPGNGWCYEKSRTEYFMDAQRKIIKGECAMMLNGSWFENEMHTELSDEKYADVEIGMFPVPEMTDGVGNVLHAEGYTTVDNKRVLTSSFGAYYFIPANAPNKETAKDFLLFLSSEEACVEYTKYSNAVRPFTYNYGTSSAVYGEVSKFGKSVLKVASENYLYAPVYESVLGVIGKGRLWALEYRPESRIVAQSPESVADLLRAEAAQASAKWNDWMTEATK